MEKRRAANLGIESMKKANKASKPSKTKAPAQKGKRQVDPILDIMKNMDEDLLSMLLQSMRNETGSGSELFGPEDPVDLFSEYLEGCTQGDVDEDEKNELLADLVEVLGELKVDSNGGDPEARRKIQAIYNLLDNAIEGHSLQVPDLMMTGKIFVMPDWSFPTV